MLFATETDLFASWRELRPDLVEDGMVDAEAYRASSPRTVFLLKEANDTSREGRWDLRSYIRDHGTERTLYNIARWSFALRSRGSDLAWDAVTALTRAERSELLRAVAFVNLKKSPGGYVAEENAIKKAAVGDREFLRAQMRLYCPEVTVWCGTDGQVLQDAPFAWRATRRGVQFAKSESLGLVIRYSHPSARASDNLLFYGFADAVRELLPVA